MICSQYKYKFTIANTYYIKFIKKLCFNCLLILIIAHSSLFGCEQFGYNEGHEILHEFCDGRIRVKTITDYESVLDTIREEKLKGYPNTPSGMPGVQTLLPVMLNHVNDGKLSLEKLVAVTSTNPAKLFKIRDKGSIAEGYDADLTLIDLKAQRVIYNEWIASKCAWTPFHGKKVTGWPRMTIVNGILAMQDDKVLGNPSGQMCQFN